MSPAEDFQTKGTQHHHTHGCLPVPHRSAAHNLLTLRGGEGGTPPDEMVRHFRGGGKVKKVKNPISTLLIQGIFCLKKGEGFL